MKMVFLLGPSKQIRTRTTPKIILLEKNKNSSNLACHVDLLGFGIIFAGFGI
jgi:hypothetical protein